MEAKLGETAELESAGFEEAVSAELFGKWRGKRRIFRDWIQIG